jgi:hypothetical protein
VIAPGFPFPVVEPGPSCACRRVETHEKAANTFETGPNKATSRLNLPHSHHHKTREWKDARNCGATVHP